MENNDSDIIEVFDSPSVKPRLRRRSSLYGSPLIKRETMPENSKLQYLARLQNERTQWLRLQQDMTVQVELYKKVEPAFTCNSNHVNAELTDFCNRRPDMVEFTADTEAFLNKLEFYKRMENFWAKKVKYAEDRLKERVGAITTKLLVDEIEEKTYL